MCKTKKSEIFQQAVALFLAEFKDGDMVTHDWLKKNFGMPVIDESAKLTASELCALQFEWLENIEAFKDALLKEHKVCLQSVRGYGYRWVRPENQTEVALKEGQHHMRKAISMMDWKVRNIRTRELTDSQRRENMDAVAKVDALRGMVKTALK